MWWAYLFSGLNAAMAVTNFVLFAAFDGTALNLGVGCVNLVVAVFMFAFAEWARDV